MPVELSEDQWNALNEMHNGCILCGQPGTGKSRTGLAYYFLTCKGELKPDYKVMQEPKDLYIITTAKKRDTLEWEKEMVPFLISSDIYSGLKIAVDSWNNIGKYADVEDGFFIFDEQRVVGSGPWVDSFLKISRNNQWILLSATPGDRWCEYIPVFIANGFYKNRTEFCQRHVTYKRIYNRMIIDHNKYIGTKYLERLRDSILVDIDYIRKTERHIVDIDCAYDKQAYREVMKNRWDPFKNEPIQNAAAFCYILRKLVNLNDDRLEKMMQLVREHPKVIIFYNLNDELAKIKEWLEAGGVEYAEWNGHCHQEIPKGEKWAYLVQYTAGSEGWNCITTDTIIFFSQNYSYKVMVQASGRTDRRNTPFKDLYYYNLKSRSPIDIAISRALTDKQKFNEERFLGKL